MFKRFICCLTICVFVSACAGTPFTWDDARKVRLGMNEDQVVEIMGKPSRVSSGPNGTTWAWVWVNPYAETRTFVLTMKNGEVTTLPDIPKSY